MFIPWLADTVFLRSQAVTEVSLLKQEKLRLQSQVKFCELLFFYKLICEINVCNLICFLFSSDLYSNCLFSASLFLC